MRIGKGVALSPEEFDRLDEGSGNGTLSDPKILYNTHTNTVSRVLLEQCENVAKAEARRLGMTCAIIRGDLHNTTRTFDIYTKEIIMVEHPTEPGKMIPLLEPIDDHLTIAFGSVRYDSTTYGTDNIQIQGHLFINVEREPGSTTWTNQRHESGLILSKPLWNMSEDFDAGLARITAHTRVISTTPYIDDDKEPLKTWPSEVLLSRRKYQKNEDEQAAHEQTSSLTKVQTCKIFWALNPNDIPRPVKEAVEKAVRQQTVENDFSCAIIRLETLGGYYGPENQSTTAMDDPIGHFAIYIGTTPADTEVKAHLSTDLDNPRPKPLPKQTSAKGISKGSTPTNPASVPGIEGGDVKPDADANAEKHDEDDGAQTPSMSEIEEEYSQVEARSKRASKRLSKMTASVGNWIRLN
ncbi:hypothetical protein DHEL01_v207390 [Diaporthe helianthi]|uniref:Uncharacterized protein n=1 Tax=Diaporthe helianthi TaxID=158607 RepID=A0A2P5HVD5_DIAHE|nr:hypothetical protein DHEL01_v207390 [Diaporthe helianthi]